MTPEELDQIEQRAELATEGPWRLLEVDAPKPELCATRIETEDEEDIAIFHIRADAEFTCHARTDIPKLVSEVRRLQ